MSEVFIAPEIKEWHRAASDGGKPYHVWASPAMPWFCVCDRNGLNVMTRGTGEVFTDEQTAIALAKEWNE